MRRKLLWCASLCAIAALLWLSIGDRTTAVDGSGSRPAAAGAAQPAVQAMSGETGSGAAAHPRQSVQAPELATVPDAPGVLRIHVREEGGEGIADQEVRVAAEAATAADGAAAVGRSDRSGRLELELAAGDYLVRMLGLRAPRAVRVEAGATQMLEITLKLGARFDGVVVDPTGQQVPSAAILVRDAYRPREAVFEAARADLAGRFSLRIPADTYCLVSAASPGFRASGEHPPPKDGEELRLVLGEAPAQLTVIVRLEDGTPAAGCWVRVDSGYEWAGNLDAGNCPTARREAHGDRDGRAQFGDLFPGPAKLVARAADALLHDEHVTLEAGRELVHVVQLRRGAALAGTVRDEQGAPVGGATIGRRWLLSTRSARDGSYRLGGLDPASTHVDTWHEEHQPARAEIALRTGETAQWDPVLRRKPVVRGRLVDGEGAPLAGYPVEAHDTSRPTYSVKARAATAADGRFEMKLPDAAPRTLEVRPPGEQFAVVPEGGVDVVPSAEELTLRLTAAARGGASVHGRALPPAGAPDAEVWVQVHRLEPGRLGRKAGVWAEAGTGEFRFTRLPAGTYRLLLGCREPAIAPIEAARFTLRPGEEHELGGLGFREAATLEVEVSMREGLWPQPPYVQLDLPDRDTTYHIARCDAGGKLRLRAEPGRYHVTIYGDGFVWQRREVELRVDRTEKLAFVLEPATRRKLFFALPDGEVTCRFEIVGPDAQTVFEAELDLEEPEMWDWQPLLGLGRHEVRATGGSGRRYAQTFVVESLGPDARGIRIAPRLVQ